MYTLRNTEARSRHICFSGKAIIIKQHVCVCVCVCVCSCSLKYPAFNAHAPYCHLLCPALQIFFTLFHKRIFEKKLY